MIDKEEEIKSDVWDLDVYVRTTARVSFDKKLSENEAYTSFLREEYVDIMSETDQEYVVRADRCTMITKERYEELVEFEWMYKDLQK